ncbi:hypothetical protein A3F66_03490 [candidate division TM6 bacterium RIFCSPHIGHO2_12_FULL_32_22]|nr:MAG: hypothetical protein A3F66_03490 [candidate division TM6 bacterium RIFCSPHIGHO2_12_FULL_32_22]
MLRERYFKEIVSQFRVHSVCAILGPRQAGKTTLAKMYTEEYLKGDAIFFDLENPIDLSRLENPMLALKDVEHSLIVIDEIQLRPDLFKVLRVIVDMVTTKHKFLILGSASRDLIQQSSETLAGRIGYIELPPFALFEVHDSAKLWIRGGFPRSYLAETEDDSFGWRRGYIKTFLERDIPNLGFNIPPVQLRRFWMMLTYYHGQTINFSEIANSMMISDNSARRYLEILAGTFMIRILQPWYENIRKRQVKSPKIYFRDSGILNALLGIKDKTELYNNPKLGAFWEGYALEEIIKFLNIDTEEAFFWATQADAELDLFIIKDGKRLGFEFKYSDAPKTTKSMHSALNDLKLDTLYIIYPGDQKFQIREKMIVCGLKNFVEK